jgi:hypothetical protein
LRLSFFCTIGLSLPFEQGLGEAGRVRRSHVTE